MARTLISHVPTKVFPKRLSNRAKLIGAQIVHRHGDRTPITNIANIESDSFWREKIPAKSSLTHLDDRFPLREMPEDGLRNFSGVRGRLTHRGLLQLQQVGKQLQEDYETLHGTRLRPERTSVLSTTFLRTVQSVQGLLDGAFPAHSTDTDTGSGTADGANNDTGPRHTKDIEPLPEIDPFHILHHSEAAMARMKMLNTRPEVRAFEEAQAEFKEFLFDEYHKVGIFDPALHAVRTGPNRLHLLHRNMYISLIAVKANVSEC